MPKTVFTSVLSPSYKEELERQLFFNQNQARAQTDVVLLIQRYGMARVQTSSDRLRVVLDLSPAPQTLYVLEQNKTQERLVGVMVYLREGDTLSLIIAAVHEDYAGVPLVWKMVDVLCDIARRVKGITSVTLFPGTGREKKFRISSLSRTT
jgi:hypothetical protein